MKTKTTTQWKHNNAYSLQVSYEVSGEAQETYFTVSSLLLNNVELSKLQIVTNGLLLISLWWLKKHLVSRIRLGSKSGNFLWEQEERICSNTLIFL